MKIKEASKLIKDFYKRFPKLKFWIDKMRRKKIRIKIVGTGRFQSKKPNISNKPRGKINEYRKL